MLQYNAVEFNATPITPCPYCQESRYWDEDAERLRLKCNCTFEVCEVCGVPISEFHLVKGRLVCANCK